MVLYYKFILVHACNSKQSSSADGLLKTEWRKNKNSRVTDWHIAHVSPISDDKNLYYPEKMYHISYMYICCKILEHVAINAIMIHTDKHKIMYPLQHCFRKKTKKKQIMWNVTKNVEN